MNNRLLATTIKCAIVHHLAARVNMVYQGSQNMTVPELVEANKIASLYTTAMTDIENIIERIVKENAEE